ncbi:hypothetical protein TARUN_6773 [Trichoderma arundinaceum]|uniref:Uncharacterized protein n=1 Tax=Trichoderma arundinaceum TaxID=490622 RepID=A0A395NI04_TRIAR|nr:hypothetical protein TARUN_6773 [Trichoderma arundinaceum]
MRASLYRLPYFSYRHRQLFDARKINTGERPYHHAGRSMAKITTKRTSPLLCMYMYSRAPGRKSPGRRRRANRMAPKSQQECELLRTAVPSRYSKTPQPSASFVVFAVAAHSRAKHTTHTRAHTASGGNGRAAHQPGPSLAVAAKLSTKSSLF